MRRFVVGVVILLGLLFSSAADAQVTMPLDIMNRPTPGAHDYIKMLSETVNPADGTVNLKIKLPDPMGRGISLPFSITYNSGSEYYLSSYQPGYLGTFLLQSPSYGGWGNSLPFVSFGVTSITYPYSGSPGSPSGTCYFSTGYSFHDSSGGAHDVGLSATSPPPSTYADCTNMGSNIPSFLPQNYGEDSQVYAAFTGLCSNGGFSYSCTPYGQPPLEVFDAQGSIYSFPSSAVTYSTGSGPSVVTWPTSIEDRNGNIIQINGGLAEQVTDTAGRSLVSITYPGGSSVNPTSISVGGLTYGLGYASFSFTSGYPGPAKQLPPLGETSIPSGLTCGFQGSNGGSLSLLHTITLPNNQKYTFWYDSTYGLLNEIDYPDGGSVKYTWEMSPVYTQSAVYSGLEQSGYQLQDGCVYLYKTPVVATRTVSFGGGGTSLTQAFNYNASWDSSESTDNQWLTKSTTVQTTDSVIGKTSQTSYAYTPVTIHPLPGFNGAGTIASQIPVEQTVQRYDWGNTTTPIHTVAKQWFDQFNVASEETTLNATSTSEVTYQYGFGGAVTQKNEYDFGSGAPGNLLRKTVTSYQAFPGNPLLPKQVQTPPSSLLTFPCQVIVYDGGGSRVAETDYLYDGGTSVCGTAGTPSVSAVSGLPIGTHDEKYYGSSTTTPASRGNVTTMTQQCFPGCAAPSITYTYDETGQVLSMKDPLHAVTQYSYADSYTSGTPSGNTNAYLTKVTGPVTNGVAHIFNYSYGYIDGQLTLTKDENGLSTTYKYTDPLDRVTETDYPDGGKTTYLYNDSVPSVTTTRLATPDPSVVTVTTMDGMGHVIETQLTSDTSGVDSTVTTYDGLGKPYYVYNPTRCNPPTTNCGTPTWGYIRHTYDALGRIIGATHPDGTSVLTSYNGRATQVSDEGNGTKSVVRVSQVDGLGRLASVCEVSSTALTNGSGGSPTSCGQDISATGFLTIYQYDAMDNIFQVNQGSLNPRKFAYDSLSRLTSSTNPEANTVPGTTTVVPTTYSYDADGNVIQRIAPAPNQQGSATVTTTYTYDALNRLTNASYNDGRTPVASYMYDQCPGCTGK